MDDLTPRRWAHRKRFAARYLVPNCVVGVALSALVVWWWRHYTATHGRAPHIELGNLADWAAAVAAGLAAAAALYIATRDRRDRQRDRLAEHRAQATLVILGNVRVGVEYANEGTDLFADQIPIFVVEVNNHGERPILNVAMHAAAIAAYPTAEAHPAPWDVDVIAPGDQRSVQTSFTVDDVRVPHTETIANPYGGGTHKRFPNADWLGVECWVRFTDAHGNIWAKSTSQQLVRLGRLPN